ncbi:MAG: hypothetical protein WCI74_01365 [Actinomycetes bacterium]
MTSPNGITWTARTATEQNSWIDVAYASNVFVAVRTGGVHQVMTSVAYMTQVPMNGCVKLPKKLRRNAKKQLETSGCVTNAGKRVGVRVTFKRRAGTPKHYTHPKLYCQVTKKKTKKVKSTGYGDGSKYCSKGSLRMRTYGSKLKIRLTWVAPLTAAYNGYQRTAVYKV